MTSNIFEELGKKSGSIRLGKHVNLTEDHRQIVIDPGVTGVHRRRQQS